ncbi:MAG: hypothetical protein J3Q66DRAFT_404649 [Benniella sp.]|nr:MAG: hypothetical protein J3Q66DRAFT_404649 [Benniella sp.]
MVFNSATSVSSDALSLKQTWSWLIFVWRMLEEPRILSSLWDFVGDADATLCRMKGSQRRALVPSKKDEDSTLSDGVATAFIDLGMLQDSLGCSDKAQTSYKKTVQWGDLLDVYQLQGLADLICGADPGYLDSDDLVKVLELLSARLTNTHLQSTTFIYQLTLAISHVLDAMADTKVNGLDPSCACQALQYVPDNDTLWEKTLRRAGNLIQGVSGLVSSVKGLMSSVKGLDKNGFLEGLGNIQQGMSRITDVFNTPYKDAASLVNGGKTFLITSRTAPALNTNELVGICQRLGEIVGGSLWDVNTRRGTVSFLREIYHNDVEWGRQVDVKQWILSILMRIMRISSVSGGIAQYTITVLEQLRTDSDPEKQTIYQSCLEDGLNSRPLVTDILWMETSPLLERLQNKPDAKASLKAPDDTHFPLMQSVKEFLEDGQHQVFLLLGDSGAGKSTFTKALECALWDDYKKKDELKDHRKLILICDGYDESQQTKNLYTANRLNQSDEWQAKMVISCRSEYENIAIGSWNRRIRLWDVGSGKYRSILIGHTSGIIHPNQRHLISKDHNDFLRVWEVETGACCHILQVSGCHVLSPRGNQIAFYKKRDDEAIELRDVETGASFRRLSGHEWPINNVAYSRQGDHIIAGDVDMAVRLWDIETGECL